MEKKESIRSYFKPIQPSVKAGQRAIIYEELEPIAPLSDLIHCYWQLKTEEPLITPFHYRVVSDGCVDIFFNVKNRKESYIMGFFNQYTSFPLGDDFHFVGIRFYPSIFPLLFEISAKTLSNQDQSLDLILPKFAKFISHEMNGSFEESITQFNHFFHTLLQKIDPKADDRFQRAFMQILKKKGHIETESELNIGLSARQLRRLFNYYIGVAPKSFCQVVRFQYILNAKPSIQRLKQHKIFFEVGFYDQAHFIKNFTRFYGVSPSKAFG